MQLSGQWPLLLLNLIGTMLQRVRERYVKKKAMNSGDKRNTSMRRLALFAAVFALVAVLFAFSRRGQREAKWPLAHGTIQETRIVPDHGLETKWGGQLTWKAQYWVAYSVAGRKYAVWADSGIRRESEAGVRVTLPQARPSCRVRYNHQKPEVSVADCQ